LGITSGGWVSWPATVVAVDWSLHIVGLMWVIWVVEEVVWRGILGECMGVVLRVLWRWVLWVLAWIVLRV